MPEKTQKNNFIRIEKTDDRFLDLLVFMLKKIDLTPENMAVMIASEITYIELRQEAMEIRFYFNQDPSIFHAKLAKDSDTIH
ncbi:hypothetical protein QQW93_00465 [Pasteurella multocida]|uniref:hypothetical protein n=3 Tax=Pasteurella multocida TaxID=747 RepID=UPI00292FAB7B|nr:hypothetical protein [Pasteurella multocida]MEB4492825.1 hypothetical protein [Pasteurella multocida]MEB4500508.1 hypothetical protein [Pasteurella multocida]MEB4511239.1 hypothetical protein [Pasteurella multocida]MEB4530749.1 hypothetical protein [Pasteurella multocida]MEB4534981.1 hypothetical protein [Pasteurella multocida]